MRALQHVIICGKRQTGFERAIALGFVAVEFAEEEIGVCNFEVASTELLFGEFDRYEAECNRTLEAGLPLPAYDYVLKCSHAFNLLDARGVISATERMGYILRVRTIAKACCASYIEHVVGSTTQDGKEAEDGE